MKLEMFLGLLGGGADDRAVFQAPCLPAALLPSVFHTSVFVLFFFVLFYLSNPARQIC